MKSEYFVVNTDVVVFFPETEEFWGLDQFGQKFYPPLEFEPLGFDPFDSSCAY